MPMAALGIAVFPLPCGQKKATLKDWPELATTDADQIERWNEEDPRYNCGAVARPDGVWILDIDDISVLGRLREETGQILPNTLTVRSRKGFHYYFKQTEASRRMGNRKLDDVFDAQVKNKYVVAPGSLHPAGVFYEIVANDAIVEAPEWLVDWVIATARQGKKKVAEGVETGAKVCRGGRDSFLFEQACYLRDRLSREAAMAALSDINKNRCAPPMPEDVVRKKIESAFSQEPRALRAFLPYTDMGNAERLVELHGEDLHYCHLTKKWLVWDGTRWCVDETGEIFRRAKETVRAMKKQAIGFDDDKQDALLKFAIKSEAQTRVSAMVELARHERPIPVRVGELDRDPMLFNVANGTLDLRTGEIREQRRDDLLTKMSPVAYDPDAQSPRWDKFLREITDSNDELVAYLRRCAGYSLTGGTQEHCLFILYGSGRNGKSTFLEVLRYILGDYSQSIDSQTLMATSSHRVRNDIAKLQGARFVTAVESEDGQRLAENLIKAMTGGDTVTARFLYSEEFNFVPMYKLWLGTNHKPVVRGTDEGIWSRVKLIPFTVYFSPEKRTKNLKDILRFEEGSGILNWALKGLKDYEEHGLMEPKDVNDAIQDYREEQDVIAQFISENCVTISTASVRRLQLHLAYCNWAGREHALDSLAFTKRLKDRGFEYAHDRNGACWKGIGLKDETDLF